MLPGVPWEENVRFSAGKAVDGRDGATVGCSDQPVRNGGGHRRLQWLGAMVVALGNGCGWWWWLWVMVVALGNGTGCGCVPLVFATPGQAVQCPLLIAGEGSVRVWVCSAAVLVVTSLLLLVSAEGALWRHSEGEKDTGEEVAGVEGDWISRTSRSGWLSPSSHSCEKQRFCELLSKVREFFDVVSMVLENVQFINRLGILLST